MIPFKKIGEYNISSIRYCSGNFSVYTGFTGELPFKKSFIINEFKHTEEKKSIFQELFLYFNSDKKTKNFKNFFSLNGYFYAVFDYFDYQNIEYKYDKKLCVSSFDERAKIFESMCIKISRYIYDKSPKIILNCLMIPENIVINEKLDVFFNLNMQKVYNLQNEREHKVQDIYGVFKIFFDVEMASKYNKTIKFISKKCELGIYKSIPELVVDLKNRYGEASISSFTQFWKYQFQIRKKSVLKYTNATFIAILAISFIFIIGQKINSSSKESTNGENISIGGINYSSPEAESSDKMISIGGPSIEPVVNEEKTNISIPQDAQIEYDDYIVKQGDTIGSIAEKYYGDKSNGSAITSFNGISGYLIPGTIIKIPSKQYLKG